MDEKVVEAFEEMIKEYEKDPEMKELIARLREIPDSYIGFMAGVVIYTSRSADGMKAVTDYMDANENLTTSDIVKFISEQPDFHDYAVRTGCSDYNDETIDPEYAEMYVRAVTESLIEDFEMNKQDAVSAVEQFELMRKISECPMIAMHDDPRNIARDIAERHLPKQDFIIYDVILSLKYTHGLDRSKVKEYIERLNLGEMIKEHPDWSYYKFSGILKKEIIKITDQNLNVYDELAENGIEAFLENHPVLNEPPYNMKDPAKLRSYLIGFPRAEWDLYLSYYLDELPDLVEEPDLLWRLIRFERAIHEGDDDKEAWRVAFMDYVRCFPWVEELMNTDGEPDLLEWQERSRVKKAQKFGMRRLFIVRKDLHMSAGKLAAQIGHCAEIYWLHMLDNSLNYQMLTDEYDSWMLSLPRDIVEGYVRGSITKTVLQARNLNHLLKARKLAEDLGLKEGYDFGFVNDLCLTELTPDEGKDTCTTCFWTRPLPNDMAWQISRKYHLYMNDVEKSV